VRYAPVVPTDDARGELPVRGPAANPAGGDTPGQLYADLDNGTYYDRSSGKVWGDMAFAGDPLDLDEEVMWSFVGNANETGDPAKAAAFTMDMRYSIPLFDDNGHPVTKSESFVVQAVQATGGTGIPAVNPGAVEPNGPLFHPDGSAMQVTKDIEVFVSGASSLLPEVSLVGVLEPGPSLSPKARRNPFVWYDQDAWDAGDEKAGFLNHRLLKGADYTLSGSFLFGGENTGAYDSDPATFSLQEIPYGTVSLLQLSGPLVPEPMTALSVLLAAGGLGGYLRRRRKA